MLQRLRRLSGLDHPAAAFLSIAAAILSIALAELVLSSLFRAGLSSGPDPGRNPHGRRDWDDYIARTSVPRPPEIRILVLSNSQARAPELPADMGYPWLLQERLNQERVGPPVRVVNWSYGPNRVPEAIILLARARELDPDVLVAVEPPNWFREEDYVYQSRPTPLSMFPGDVVDTAWLYRDRFPAEFRRHYLRPVHFVNAGLARYLPTYRYRDWALSFAKDRVSWVRPFVPEREEAGWFMTGGQRRQPLRRPPAAAPPAAWPHPALLRMFIETAAPLRARKVFVLQPNPYRVDPGLRPLEALHERLARSGWAVWDMMAAVPWPQFLEGNVHFAAAGHRAFADRLAARLRPLLERPE